MSPGNDTLITNGSIANNANSSSIYRDGPIKRKAKTPLRSIKNIVFNPYEKAAQGIIQLNFISDDLVLNRKTGEFGLSGTSDDNDNENNDNDNESELDDVSNSESIGNRSSKNTKSSNNNNNSGSISNTAMTRRSVRGSSRLAGLPPLYSNGNGNNTANSGNSNDGNDEDESSGSDADEEMIDDVNDSSMKNEGAPSKKYRYDPSQSVAFLTSREHVKPIGLLSRKGKIGAPLDICRMENIDDLNEEEFHICSVLRIFPSQYLKAKEVMTAEAKIRGYFKKSAAQKMLRMDVNKTGKLYDYFTEMGWIKRG